MNRKIIAAGLAVLIIAVSFASCGKKFSGLKFIDGDGNKAVAVTDESGNIVLDEDGSVVVFATDSKGNFVKAENGDPATTPAKPGNAQKIGDYYDSLYIKMPIKKGWAIDEYVSRKLIKKDSSACIELGVPTKKYKNIDEFVKERAGIFDLLKVSYTISESSELSNVPAKVISVSAPDKEIILKDYFFRTSQGIVLITCSAKTQADFDSADFASILKESVVRV